MRFRIFTEPQQGATYDDLLAVAKAAEQFGYDAFFRSDHYLAMNTAGLPGPTFLAAAFGGHDVALAVAFDRVTYAYGPFSLLRPRRPASGDGFNCPDVTKRFRVRIRIRVRLGTRLVAGGGV